MGFYSFGRDEERSGNVFELVVLDPCANDFHLTGGYRARLEVGRLLESLLQLLTPFHVLSAVRVDDREGIAAGDAVDFNAIIRLILVPDSV